MTTLLLNTFLVLITLFFGAMAYYPLFLKAEDTELPSESFGDDVVISVVPSYHEPKRPTLVPSTPRGSDENTEHPGHVPAA